MTCLSPAAVAADVRIEQRIPVDSAWAGHPVGFALLTDAPNNLQYVGYYDADRNMVIASRRLDSEAWTKKILPTKVAWDSHNYITMALDRDGQLHVAGNMHRVPLIYFRTTHSGDVASLASISSMIGNREKLITYPHFIKDTDGGLIFTYREGGSGNGVNLYNKYDEKSQAWSRLLDVPLFDGLGKMNAYPDGPKRGPDGFWHVVWVWRDTPAAETNHDLSYARSRDLKNWATASGVPLTLPISINTPGLILDPIPVNGGIINGSPKVGFDENGHILIAYLKFDGNGFTQIHLACFVDDAWQIRPLTNWNYRWEPKGVGTIPINVRHSGVQQDPAIGSWISLYNIKTGWNAWRLNTPMLELGERISPTQVPGHFPPELGKGVRPPLSMRTSRDSGSAPKGTRYLLRWESHAGNQDREPTGPLPEPSLLELITLSD